MLIVICNLYHYYCKGNIEIDMRSSSLVGYPHDTITEADVKCIVSYMHTCVMLYV